MNAVSVYAPSGNTGGVEVRHARARASVTLSDLSQGTGTPGDLMSLERDEDKDDKDSRHNRTHPHPHPYPHSCISVC